ncbi:thiamine pyrophosphate-dependent enzyme [Zooshikella harenae]|uniref:Thiamine pyrophosphate-binding protein n=1 Tax=Zooshikella harenae TaxID=2827238 RepID=A0ABS5ZIL5_9GAMM|nr:thiamine pyrophosphate-dependent enzyme [Zooshikella harenae]MBU2713765.1 hypothetical protein [Zooshikella harenae]
MKYFSDLIVEFLTQQGIDYVSFNPGASFRGVHDSLVNLREQKNTPQIIMSCHEEISVAIAHGYYKACGKHMVVLVHANIGLQHASMAIFNAWCDRVPLLVLGGNGPLDASKRRPWIDWIHTSQGIDSMLQGFTKWTDLPISQKATIESLYRGLRLMNTEAKGPVFISLDAAVQEEKLGDDVILYPAETTLGSVLPAIDDSFAEFIAHKLLSSSFPILIVDFSGKDSATVETLIMLADELGIAVVDRGGRYNFPNTHSLSIVDEAEDIINSSDFILALEVQDLWGALNCPAPDAFNQQPYIATLSSNDMLMSSSVTDYQHLMPVNLSLHAHLNHSLQKILKIITKRQTNSSFDSMRANRIGKIKYQHDVARTKWLDFQVSHRDDDVIHVSSALATIHDNLKSYNWIVTNTGSVTIDAWVKKLWDLDREGCYLGLSGGAGLGYGLGASIGAALAHKDDDTICINLQSDGDFLYTPSGLWTLSQYDIPLLTIVMNNQLYLNSKQHAEIIALARKRDQVNSDVATSFHENPVDFLALADSFNIYNAGKANTLKALESSLENAIDYILTHRKPCLVEVIMQ